MKTPKEIDLKQEEVDKLRNRLKHRQLEDADYELLDGVLQFMFWLQFTLQKAKISIHRLRRLFGIKTEKKQNLSGDQNDSPTSAQKKTSDDESAKEDDDTLSSEMQEEDTASDQEESSAKGKGHGRNGASVYTGAETVKLNHESLKPGDPCPLECGGRLYEISPGVVIRVTGSPITSATRYELEKLRCSLCGEIFTTPLPEGVDPEEKYDEKSKAVLALQKYFLGSPFYRMERFQDMVGVPLPDATMWDLVEQVADCLYPVFRQLEILAAQGEVVFNDDTTVRILSLMKENKENPDIERRAMYTTGIIVLAGLHQIALFYTGRQNAGENLDGVLKHRLSQLQKIIQMSDALSANRTEETETLWCKCITHGRRKFVELYHYYPEECQVVIDAIAEVYHFDETTKEKEMSAEERLEFHQCYSTPVMEELKEWLDEQIQENKVEPNGDLGLAIKYLQRHWPELTQFLRVPGAPLDTNIVERALKIPILNRKNAMFYKTEHGALVGDIIMSVIYTCYLAGENPLDYLITLQQNRHEVFKEPLDWFPWNFREALVSIAV